MMTGASPIFSPKDKIQILLAEYAGLRMETIHRTNNLYQLIAALVVLLGFATSRTSFDWRFWLYSGSAATLSTAMGWLLYRDTQRAAARVREIEAIVNDLAGESILEWETRWGGGAVGYFAGSWPLPPN
jgi:hypothetical protein